MPPVLEFNAAVNWPNSYYTGKDFDYIRKRVTNNRSSISQTLTLYESRYFDAARTLVDALELIVGGIPGVYVDKFSLQVAPTHITKIVASGTIHDDPAIMIMTYSCNYTALEEKGLNQYDKLPDGYFKISLEPTEPTAKWHRVTVGTHTLRDIACGYTNDEDRIYPVNENSIIGYAETLPMPTVFIENLRAAWCNSFDTSLEEG